MKKRRRKINVRKHRRRKPLGGMTIVRRHNRFILNRQQSRKTKSEIEREKRKTFREKVRREWVYPSEQNILLDPAIFDSEEPYQFVSAEERGTAGEQTEGARWLELKPPTKSDIRIRTEIGVNQRLEDRLSKRDLKSYFILRKEIPSTDKNGNILYDEYGEPIMEETQLVLPPLPIPGQLDAEEVFELQLQEGKGGGYVVDEEGKLIFKRVFGEDTIKTQDELAKQMESLDPNSKEYQNILMQIISLQSAPKQWVVFDIHGLPILADHVSIYAIKGVDAEVGDLLQKMGIYTVSDYMEWRRELAGKKIRDDESGITYDLIETIDEYNNEAIRDRIHALEKMRKELSGRDFEGNEYSALVLEELEKIPVEEHGTLAYVNRMQNAISRISLKKEREDAIREEKAEVLSRKGIGGRPGLVSNRALSEQKKYYTERLKQKQLVGKNDSFERMKLNAINHRLKIRKMNEKVNRIDSKTHLDELGRFLIASGYFSIPIGESISTTRKKYLLKRKDAIKTLKKQGYLTKNGISFYPKPELAEQLRVDTQKTHWPVEFDSDIYVVDDPRTKMQENWHYAELGEDDRLNPKSKVGKEIVSLNFDEKLWAQKTKAKQTSTSLLKSRKGILRSGTSYFNRDQIQRAYASVQSDDLYKLAEDAGFGPRSYLIRAQLRDKDEVEYMKDDWKFVGKPPKEKEFFKGSSLVFDTQRAIVSVDPILSHYGKNKPIIKDVEKELKKKRK